MANLPKTLINRKSKNFKVHVNTDEVHVVFLEAVQKNKASE